MVFCGKPSRSCHACRERKTRVSSNPQYPRPRCMQNHLESSSNPLQSHFSDSSQCDLKPQGCGQCANARRKCPGYRKLGDVIFKDESGKVMRKFQEREARSSQMLALVAESAVGSDECSTDQEDCMEFVLSDTTTLPVFNLAPTIEERAIAFFINNYVVAPDGGPSMGHMTIIHGMKGSLPECLFSSMKAVGIASYAHSVYAPSLMQHARYQYVQALRATNEALKSPVHVTKDSTLISIIILSIYEAVTGTNQKSLKAWSDHIFGASALLKRTDRHNGRPAIIPTDGIDTAGDIPPAKTPLAGLHHGVDARS
jgi:hypothetical protein